MFRILISGLLVLATASAVAAQTVPARTGQKTGTAARKPISRSQSSATTTAQPAARGTKNLGLAGNGAVGSTESADGKGQNSYAAPGMPVNVDDPKKVEGYNGPAPTSRTRTGTTLTPARR